MNLNMAKRLNIPPGPPTPGGMSIETMRKTVNPLIGNTLADHGKMNDASLFLEQIQVNPLLAVPIISSDRVIGTICNGKL